MNKIRKEREKKCCTKRESEMNIWTPSTDLLTLSCMGGFWTDISKSSEREGDQFFFLYFFQMAIRNKKVCKVKNFQVWIVSWYFE